MNKDYIDYLNTQMRYFRSFDIDMYIHYRNKLRMYKLNTTKVG